MKSVSFKNLVLLIIVMLWGRVPRRYGILDGWITILMMVMIQYEMSDIPLLCRD